MGCETWPNNDRYKVCPSCGEKTTVYRNMKPLTQEEASTREFELFYERWDDQHDESRLAGDAPDARGPFAGVEDSRPAALELPPGPAG